MISNGTERLTNTLKTFALLAALGGLLVLAGGLVAGRGGMLVALVFALILNFGVYWFSDRIALKANGARPLVPGEMPFIERTVADLAMRARIPMPSLHVIDRSEPNAFATGRSPSHSAVAVTTGPLESMSERQVRGVLAHELSHVTNLRRRLQRSGGNNNILGILAYSSRRSSVGSSRLTMRQPTIEAASVATTTSRTGIAAVPAGA